MSNGFRPLLAFPGERIYPDGLLQKWNARVPQLEVRAQDTECTCMPHDTCHDSYRWTMRTEYWQSMTRRTSR